MGPILAILRMICHMNRLYKVRRCNNRRTYVMILFASMNIFGILEITFVFLVFFFGFFFLVFSPSLNLSMGVARLVLGWL
jgi:hypothetical protein